MGIIVKEIFINAPPNVVCDFLTDPEKLARWMGVVSDEKRSRDRKRGKRVDTSVPSGQVQKVLNSKVTFRWEVYAMGTSVMSVVEIDLERRGDGTWVRLTHKETPKRLERTTPRKLVKQADQEFGKEVAERLPGRVRRQIVSKRIS